MTRPRPDDDRFYPRQGFMSLPDPYAASAPAPVGRPPGAQGRRFRHACSLRRMLDDAPVPRVGLRSAAAEEADLIRERNLPFFSPRDLRALPDLGAIVDTLSAHVYVTLDLDGIDSGEMPAGGTPQPGGLTWDEARAVLEGVSAKRGSAGVD